MAWKCGAPGDEREGFQAGLRRRAEVMATEVGATMVNHSREDEGRVGPARVRPGGGPENGQRTHAYRSDPGELITTPERRLAIE